MTNEEILDYSFPMPVGLEGVSYRSPEDSEVDEEGMVTDEFDESTDEFSGSDDYDDLDSTSTDEDLPYPPDYMTVVSQEVRTLKGGGQVVDVTIELPDLDDEGTKYDLRVTKA